MSDSAAVAALSSIVALLVLLTFGFWLYRTIAIAWFRQAMFALRDEVFDMAADGAISFNHPAYGLLRTTMNGFIRYAHRLNWLSFVWQMQVWEKSQPAIVENYSFQARWTQLSEQLSRPLRDQLNKKMDRMHTIVLMFVLFGTPTATAITLVAAIFVVVRSLSKSVKSSARAAVNRWLGAQGYDPVDSRALECGAMA